MEVTVAVAIPSRAACFSVVLLLLAACVAPEPIAESEPGRGLTPADDARAEAAMQEALERLRSRDALPWKGLSESVSGSVMPLRSFRIQSGAYCRAFLETISVAGHSAETERTACRDADGTWLVIDG